MGRGRAPCCDKSQVKKGPWSPAEDLRLMTFIQKYGHENWRALPIQAGLLRCGKSCRLRWINYLRPDLKRGNFAKEEEDMIIKLHQTFGNKWSKIASKLPGRTDNEIKNVWNTHFKKRWALMNANATANNSIEESYSSASSSSNDTVSCGDKNMGTKLDQAAMTKLSQVVENNQDSSQKLVHDPVKELSSSTISSNISNVTSSSQNNVTKRGCTELLNVLEEVNQAECQHKPFEIPLETDSDFWCKLNSLSYSMQYSDDKLASSEKVEEMEDIFFEEIENNRWLRYLESELGLDETPHGEQEEKSSTGDACVMNQKFLLRMQTRSIN